MGFGSYDESEQENHSIDIDAIDGGERRSTTTHDGKISFEYDNASSEDLLEAYEEFQNG